VQYGVCGSQSPAAKRFCGESGPPLAEMYLSCVAGVEQSDKFRGDCRTAPPVPAAVAAPAAAAPTACQAPAPVAATTK
jgi:hypothetical protein